jgi:hypothetical protein
LDEKLRLIFLSHLRFPDVDLKPLAEKFIGYRAVDGLLGLDILHGSVDMKYTKNVYPFDNSSAIHIAAGEKS